MTVKKNRTEEATLPDSPTGGKDSRRHTGGTYPGSPPAVRVTHGRTPLSAHWRDVPRLEPPTPMVGSRASTGTAFGTTRSSPSTTPPWS